MSEMTTRAAALIAFAEYIKESRGLETVTEAQCQEIAEHWLRNMADVESAYEVGFRIAEQERGISPAESIR